MVDRALRPMMARALAPLANALREVPPGALTAVGLGVGLGAAVAAATGAFWIALALWLLNRLLDGTDGEVARRSRDGATLQSDRGGYLDLMADVTVYAAVTIGIAAGATAALGGEPLAPTVATWAAAAILLAAYYVNFGSLALLAALLEKRRPPPGDDAFGRSAIRVEPTSLTMPAGIVEGAETIVLLGLALAFPTHAHVWFGVGAALVALTALQRVLWAERRLRGDA